MANQTCNPSIITQALGIQATGPRTVIVPADPIIWDAETSYEYLTLVASTDFGQAYISKRDVPAGTALTDTDYWIPAASFNAQLAAIQASINTLTSANEKYAAYFGNCTFLSDFNPAGDGTTDDSAAITAAVNDAVTNKRPLVVPAKTYYCSTSITVPAGYLRVIGVSRYGSVIKFAGNGFVCNPTTVNESVVTIENMVLDGSGTGTGISVSNVGEVVIAENASITNFATGISGDTIILSTIRNCVITGTSDYGIYLHLAYGCLIEEGQVNGTAGTNIHLQGAYTTRVSELDISAYGAVDYAAYLSNCNGVDFSPYYEASENGPVSAGIYVYESNAVTVHDIYVPVCAAVSDVVVDNSKSVEITKLSFVRPSTYPIDIKAMSYGFKVSQVNISGNYSVNVEGNTRGTVEHLTGSQNAVMAIADASSSFLTINDLYANQLPDNVCTAATSTNLRVTHMADIPEFGNTSTRTGIARKPQGFMFADTQTQIIYLWSGTGWISLNGSV